MENKQNFKLFSMEKSESCDLSLMCWNILAPCWVEKEWYPSLYELAADSKTRMKKILSKILSSNCNIIFVQEAELNFVNLLKKELNEKYLIEFAENNPSSSSIPNGLLTLIDKSWKYSNEIKIYNEILDPIQGDAIQFLHLYSKKLYLINLHLDYIDPLRQANMIQNKFNYLFGDSNSISILGGDFNAEKDLYDKFPSFDYENVFDETKKEKIIPSYYEDPRNDSPDMSIDHIFYDPKQIKLIDSGKAFNQLNKTLQESLQLFGSDHIFIWANFTFL